MESSWTSEACIWEHLVRHLELPAVGRTVVFLSLCLLFSDYYPSFIAVFLILLHLIVLYLLPNFLCISDSVAYHFDLSVFQLFVYSSFFMFVISFFWFLSPSFSHHLFLSAPSLLFFPPLQHLYFSPLPL